MSSGSDPGGPPTQPVKVVGPDDPLEPPDLLDEDVEAASTTAVGGGSPLAGSGAGGDGQSGVHPRLAGGATQEKPAKPTRAEKKADKMARGRGFRYRILPRSVLGVSSLILAFAIGAGFSGVVLFSYYQYKLTQSDAKVNALVSGYKQQFAKARSDLAADVAAAQSTIQQQLKAVQQLQVGPDQLANLTRQVSPSVFFVHTLDSSGQPSVASAFVISSNTSQSLLITSYAAVEAATHSPGPVVYARQNNADIQVTVRSWDAQYDLALLVLPEGNLKALTAAPTTPSPQPGDRVYTVSGLGSAGASLAPGTIIDAFTQGLATDAPVGSAFQGGPVINQSAQVVAVASRVYAPLGFQSSGVWYVPYVEAACSHILVCPGGTLVGSH